MKKETLALAALLSISCNSYSTENTPLPFSITLSARDGQLADHNNYQRPFWGVGINIGDTNERGLTYSLGYSQYRIESGNGFEGLNTSSTNIELGYRDYPFKAYPIYLGSNIGHEYTSMEEYYDFCNCSEKDYGLNHTYIRPYIGLSLGEESHLDAELSYKSSELSTGGINGMVQVSIIVRR